MYSKPWEVKTGSVAYNMKPPPCPECESKNTQSYYAELLYRCKDCGVKYGPYLENMKIKWGEPSDDSTDSSG